MKVFSKQIYSYDFHIFKLNNLKVIYDLYSQCLIQTLSKTTCFMGTKVVCEKNVRKIKVSVNNHHLLANVSTIIIY